MEKDAKLKVIASIEKDNARRKMFDSVMPKAIEVWNKYEGKQYGEKTKEKIHAEIQAACRVNAYFYGDELHFMPCTEDGYNDMRYSYDDFKACTTYDHDKNAWNRFINANNTIQAISIDKIKMEKCHDYIENVEAYADSIINTFADFYAKYEELLELCKEYNAMIPSTMTRKHPDSMTQWLF